MTITVSVASGKGGVGKSVVASKLGLLFAQRGKTVNLVDLDVGGANLHILFGMIHPKRTLSDFIYHRVSSMEEVSETFNGCSNLRIIAGTGETLSTANMPYSRKKRIIKHLKHLPADIVLVDVGPGTNFHSLDFFLMGDHHITVATPDPTSVLDLYRFIKLAAIRRVLSLFIARGTVSEALVGRDFSSVAEVFETVGQVDEISQEMAKKALAEFKPCLILNRVSGSQQFNTGKRRMLLKEYVGGDLENLGELPEDSNVGRSVRSFLPVVDFAPASAASEAFNRIADLFLKRV